MQTRIILTLLGVTFALAAPSANAARSFCCTDDQGHRTCGDVLPESCASRPYTEFNERGVRVRSVEAPLSEAQQAAREGQLKKKREADRQALEQHRRDTALLATYATEPELDASRDRAVREVERGITQAQQKLDQAQAQQKKLAKDMEFYRGKPEGDDIKDQISRNDLVIKTQQESIAAKQRRIEEINAKFDADRQRLRELRGSASGQQ